MSLGSEIKKWREAADKTQVQLAALVDVSPRTVQNWEAGGHMKVGDFNRVVQALDVGREEAMRAVVGEA